jgi:hypothetical protein
MLLWPLRAPAAAAAPSGRGQHKHSALIRSYVRREGIPVQALSALTPPLLMCAVVLIAIVAFLRHEMGKKRPDESESAHDIPSVPQISDHRADDQMSDASSADKAGDG